MTQEIREQSPTERPSLASFIGKGKGCFASAAEVDAFIRAERDDWEGRGPWAPEKLNRDSRDARDAKDKKVR